MEYKIPLKGVVGFEITSVQLQDQLNQLGLTKKDEVRFEVNSPGGSVPEGFEIFNIVKNTPGKKVFEVTGIAMSIMSLIIMSGDEIEASEISMFMIHKASTGMEGNSDDLQKQAEILDKIDQILVEQYYARNKAKGKVKLSKDELMEMLAAETWLSPKEALEYGFVDRIVNKSDYKVAAQAKDFIFTNKSQMKHLQRLRALLAMDKPQLTDELIKDEFAKAIAALGKAYKDLTDEEVATLTETVKGAITEAIGAETLTAEEAAQVEAALKAAVEGLTAEEQEEEEQEEEPTEEPEEEEEEYAAQFAKQAEINQAITEALSKNSEVIENLSKEITALKKGVRTFSKKNFVNESTKVNLGTQYTDPYAKHRAEMAEIDARTRAGKSGVKK